MSYLALPFVPAFNTFGLIAGAARLEFYLTGTTTPSTVYSDAALTTPLGSTVTADAFGRFVAIYLDPLVVYRVRLETALGALIDEADGIMGGASALDTSFLQAGTGAVPRTVQSKLRDTVNVKDFGAVWDNVTNDRAAIQAAIDSTTGPLEVILPAGTGLITGTIYLRRDGVRLRGCGTAVTNVRFVNAAGGIVFSGDTNTVTSLNEYADCALLDFTVVRSDNNPAVSATLDPDTVVDLTSFSYGHFNIGAQTTRPNACIYYGRGNAGTAPYFNHIESSSGLFGGADQTQEAFRFEAGAWAGGSNGPNANVIGPITRAASLSRVFNIKSGQGNLCHGIGAESIKDAYIKLGGAAAVQTGTSSGSNSALVIKDTTKTWVVNAYVNGAVKITGGTGSGQIRRIADNTATQLNLTCPWATIPDATSTYSVFELLAHNNKFVNIRQEGLVSSVFIDAYEDSDGTEILNTSVQSSGGYLTDRSCSPNNKFYGASRAILQHTFITPGASANVQGFARSSVFGGAKFAGLYVVDWVMVDMTTFSAGDTATITVDCGGATVGSGSPTLPIVIPTGQSTGAAFPVNSRPQVNGVNNAVFLNLQTGAAFGAGVSVGVTIAVTLVAA
jgi:Pectate lyase superfamily protein